MWEAEVVDADAEEAVPDALLVLDRPGAANPEAARRYVRSGW
ncbi:hypothetical protein PPSIR1_25956, partial [Plesiocystis pacifica SIR-1]